MYMNTAKLSVIIIEESFHEVKVRQSCVELSLGYAV